MNLPIWGFLKSKHVFFIGDSTVRYLYLTVALLLRGGVDWRGCRACGGSDCGSSETCPWNERSYGSWPSFFVESSAAVGGHCDCARSSTWCTCAHRTESGSCCTAKCCDEVLENRYLEHEAGGSLSYLQLLSGHGLAGRWLPGDPDAWRRPHRIDPQHARRWTCDTTRLEDCAALAATPRDATVVVWNVGHWRFGAPVPDAELRAIHASLRKVAAHVVFITTIGLHPPAQHVPDSVHFFNTSRSWQDVPASSRWTHDSFWDRKVHLHGAENRQLALDLLRHITAHAPSTLTSATSQDEITIPRANATRRTPPRNLEQPLRPRRPKRITTPKGGAREA